MEVINSKSLLATVAGGYNTSNGHLSANVESCGISGDGCVSLGPVDGFPGCSTGIDACSCDADGGGGGGGGGGKVICTELCRTGVIDHDVWIADLQYSRKSFSERTMRGYHLWGIPYVKLMRRFPVFSKMAAYPTRWFAEDIAYRMGVRSKPNLKGWLLREAFFRPVCNVIGLVAKSRDWQALWRNQSSQARAV